MAGAKCSAPNRTRPGSCGRPLSNGVCPHHGTAGVGTAVAQEAPVAAMAAVASADPWEPQHRTELTGGPDGDWERVRTGWTHPETGTAYDPEGYTRSGFDADGFDRDGYNRAGYDRGGFDREGFDQRGFDADGIHPETGTAFGPDGRDHLGFDGDGWSRPLPGGKTMHRDTGSQFGPDGRDRDGYDERGRDRDGHDRSGFNREGIHRETGTRFGPAGADGIARASEVDLPGDYYVTECKTANGDIFYETSFEVEASDNYGGEIAVSLEDARVQHAGSDSDNHYFEVVADDIHTSQPVTSFPSGPLHRMSIPKGSKLTQDRIVEALDGARTRLSDHEWELSDDVY